MFVKNFISDETACGVYRGFIPAVGINEKRRDIHVDCSPSIYPPDFCGTDTFVFMRACTPPFFPALQEARRRGIRVVYDIDDNLFAVPDCHPEAHKGFSHPDMQSRIASLLSAADMVVAVSEPLAEVVRKHNGRVAVIPNFMDLTMGWNDAYWKRNPRQEQEAVSIYWHGSQSHKDDFNIVKGPLCQVLSENKNVTFTIIGMQNPPDGIPVDVSDQVKIIKEWVPYFQLPELLAKASIGLCVMGDTPFNRCRGYAKWMEYGAIGKPVIASDIVYSKVIEDGVTGLIAKSEQDWYNHLTKLINDNALRVKIGTAARWAVESKHEIRRNIDPWVAAYTGILP